MEVSLELLEKLARAIMDDSKKMSPTEYALMERLIPNTYAALLELFSAINVNKK